MALHVESSFKPLDEFKFNYETLQRENENGRTLKWLSTWHREKLTSETLMALTYSLQSFPYRTSETRTLAKMQDSLSNQIPLNIRQKPGKSRTACNTSTS